MNVRRIVIRFLGALAASGVVLGTNAAYGTSPEAQQTAYEEPATADPVEAFRDAKFGMFIHWGLYSQTGGIWQGKRYYGITEWLMKRGEIPSASYATIADDFNPVRFDAKQWVQIAKDAGVKYIVITAKHHDGFAMFDSAVSEFDIVDATPFKRDPLRELTDAARAEGIKIGFYYSQFQDWTEPNASGNDWEFDPDAADFGSYLVAKAKPQLRELLTNYGPIDLIWFDTPGSMSIEDSKALKAWVKELQPNCLVSDRIGHSLGDYKGYRDGEIPEIPEAGRPWEAIFTHNDSWGYSSFDNNFKSTSEVLDLLSLVASRGGNLMLNIGPDGLGRFPDQSIDTFHEVGRWLRVNGEAIYGTEGSPLGPMPWGQVTQRPGKLYLLVSDTPTDGDLIVPGLTSDVSSVSLLATGQELSWQSDEAGTMVMVALPDRLPDARISVIVIDYIGDIKVDQANPVTTVSTAYDGVELEAAAARIDGQPSIRNYRSAHYFGDWKHDAVVAGFDDTQSEAVWRVRVTEPGTYKISLNYSAGPDQAGQEGVVEIAGEEYFFKVLETGSPAPGGDPYKQRPLLFLDHPIAVITFDEAGTYDLTVKADILKDGTELFRLRRIGIETHD